MGRAAWKQGVLGSLAVVMQVLSLRLIVLVAISGGIALSYMALYEPNPFRLGVLVIYAVGVVIPVVALAARH